MKNYRLHLSEGFKDTYGDEMLVKKEIEGKTLDIFAKYGYELIKTPTLEYIDVFSKDGSQKPDLYNLINRQGEVLSLCNDMTASIARFVCSNNSLPMGPKKYCYIADTFRYPRLYQGKNHQFLQAGVEFIGDSSFEADIRVISLAYETIKACNVKDFTVHLGSSDFLNALFLDFGIDNDIKNKVYSLIDNKDYVTLRTTLEEVLDDDNANFLIDLMLKGGKLHYMEKLIASLEGKSSKSKLVYLKQIYETLNLLGIDNIVFDFSIYSYAKYYTGIIFAIYVGGIGKTVVSGGRCDNLFKDYGKDLSDCGFGLDIDSLATYVLENNLINVKKRKCVSYIHDGELIRATKENNELRDAGVVVSEVHFNSLEEALNYAKENGYQAVMEYKDNTSKLWEVK